MNELMVILIYFSKLCKDWNFCDVICIKTQSHFQSGAFQSYFGIINNHEPKQIMKMETDPPAHYFHLPDENDLFIVAPLLALIALPHTEAVVLHAQRAITAVHTPHSSFYSLCPSLASCTCSHCITDLKNESTQAHICVLGVPAHFGPHVTSGRLKYQMDFKQDQCPLHGHTLKTSPC